MTAIGWALVFGACVVGFDLVIALQVAAAALATAATTTTFAGFVADIRRALLLADVPLKAAAIEMGIDHALLIRQLQGIGHLSLRRLSRIQSPEFWRWLAVLQAVRLGLPEELQRSRRLINLLNPAVGNKTWRTA